MPINPDQKISWDFFIILLYVIAFLFLNKSMKLARYLYQMFLYGNEIDPSGISFSCLYNKILIFSVLIFGAGTIQKCFANQYQAQELSTALNPLSEQTQLLSSPTAESMGQDLLVGNHKITFLGNMFFSLEQLKKKLFVLEDPGFFEPGLMLNDLLMLYKDHGFLEAKISFEEQVWGSGLSILFRINEGDRVKINDITIKGIIEPKFSAIIKDIFSELKQGGYFDMDRFNDLVGKVKDCLSRYGFWDFELKKYKLLLNKNSSCDLLLEINQGGQKLLKKMIIENDSELDIDLSGIDLPVYQTAIPFDFSLIDTYKNIVLATLQPLYAEVVINHEIVLATNQSNQESNNYMLVFRIVPKNVLYFGEIIINGCSRTLPATVLKNLTFKEGDVWDFDKIEGSLKKLKDLKIFKSVSIVPENFFEKKSRKTTMINVVEDSMLEVIGRFGFAQISGVAVNQAFSYLPGLTYKLGGSFLWKNVSGVSDIFRLDFDSTGFSTNFAALYEKPLNLAYLPGITFSSKIFNNQIEQPLPGMMGDPHQKAYIEKHTGLMLNFDYDATKFNVFLSAALDCIQVSSLNPAVFKTLQIDSTFFNNRIPYAILEPSIVLNRFDNDIDPTKGFRTSLNFKAMLPLNNLSGSSLKILFEHSHVMPITRSSSFALKFRAGYIFNKNIETILPTERFYLGGLNSIRSYDLNMVPPTSSFCWDDNQPSGLAGSVIAPAAIKTSVLSVPIGAKFLVNLNAEWRCALYDKLSGVIFNDIGLLNRNKLRDISARDVVGATGFGLRYATPIGPIRFDIGFKWKRQKDEKPFNWYLTFGQSF